MEETSFGIIASADIASLCELKTTTSRCRWAMRIAGLDADGRPRVLALDWDGRWHPLDPETGEPARIGVVVRFRDLQVGEVAFSERPGDHWPYAARLGPREYAWTKHGYEHRLQELDNWEGEDDPVRIFAVGVTDATLRQTINEHHAKAGGR